MDGGSSSVRAAFPELTPDETTTLERGLIERAVQTPGSRIVSVLRSPLASTWYRTELLEVRSDSGETAKVFLKDFRSFVRSKSKMEERRERERYLYRDLCPDGSFGLPRYIAELWDRARSWLLLEYVEGGPLAWCGLKAWFEAAAWLGRFQTGISSMRPEIEASGRFSRHDRVYFEKTSATALEGAAEFGEDVVSPVEQAIPRYLEQTADLMASRQTLVHGAFRPAQILVQETPDGPRICPVDWEVSALGSCLYDLAVLADGFEGAELETFLGRFLAEATWLEPRPPTLSDLQAAMRASRTHRTMKWIGHAHARGMDEEVVRTLAASLFETEEPLR